MTQAVEQEVWDNYNSCIKAHAEVLPSMSEDCPYNQYRAAKGIRKDIAKRTKGRFTFAKGRFTFAKGRFTSAKGRFTFA